MAVAEPITGRARSRTTIVVIVCTVLLVAIALQFLRQPVVFGSASQSGQLAKALPAALEAWQVRDEPLGDTEALKLRVQELLNYDDYVYRIYSAAGREFSVYAAHWAPGRMPTRLVALHTPDRCWIENGWACHAAQFNAPVAISGIDFPPAQRREFSPPNRAGKVFASFWLITGGKPYDLGDRMNTVPSPFRWSSQVIRESFRPDGEQLFVRVTSDRPLEHFAGDAGFEQVMAAVSKLLTSQKAGG